MDFGFVPLTPYALTSCHIVISKQGMAERRSRLVEQVCNRKETRWYENHVIRFRQSVQSESRVEPGIRSRSEALVSSLTIRLARGCKRWHPWPQEEDMGQEETTFLSIRPSISQSYNKLYAPFENKMREIYFFIKKCASFRFVN